MLESISLGTNQKIIPDLKRIPTLSPFSDHDLQRLLAFSKIRKYKTGEEIITEGTYDGNLYILIFGRIRVTKKGRPLCVLDKRGDIFGEMSLLGEFSRTASVYAEEDVVCLAIDNTSMHRLSESEKASLYYILYRIFAQTLAGRLKLTSEELISVKSKYLKFI
ncbi:MAG: cyclic nucleotide-binding domain-containing protein [Thermodesulfobacteriota bacterium]